MPDQPSQPCEFNADELDVRVEMTIPADVEAISPAVDRIMQTVRRTKCVEGKDFEIDLALREALANAIVHGCKGDKEKEIQFCVACDKKKGILIVVRDPGPGFDPAEIPSPTRGENLYYNHGRGIFLINQLMDEVRFEKGGTEIHMIKK